MKTCSRCGRSYPDAQLLCAVCGLSLPKGEAADVQTVAHINYLLGELPQWVIAGWLDSRQAQHLGAQYERRRSELLAGGAPPSWASPTAPPLPPGPAAPAPVGPAAPSTVSAAPLAAFREDRSLAYWLLVGALFLLAGVLASVIWAWQAAAGRSPVFTLLLALTGGFAALARSRVVREERITSTVLTTIAAVLVPVDLFVGNAFLLVGGQLTNEGIGLLSTLLCLPLYAWMAHRREGRTFLLLAALDISAALHFLLQAAVPSLLHTHDPARLYSAYGPPYTLLAAVYLFAATREGHPQRRGVWRGLLHATAAAAIAVSLGTGALRTFGPAAVTLLLAGALYTGASFKLRQPTLASLSIALTILGAGLGLVTGHISPISQSYVYVLVVLTIALGLRGLSMRVQGDSVAMAFARGALAVTWLAVIAQTLRAVAALETFPIIFWAGPELWGALACAALTGAYFAWAGSRGMADALLAYGVVLLGLVAAHTARWAAPGNVGLSLAVATAILWARRREDSVRVCGWIALGVCGMYMLHGGFLGTTTLALLLILGVTAQTIWSGGAASSTWLALAAATGLTVVWETHALPALRPRLGLEPNNGYGLFLLTMICLALYARRRDPALRHGAAALGLGNAALQLVYAVHGTLPYSPLALLGAGVALCTAIAWARRSERFALWATTLVAYAYVTYLVGLVGGSPPAREIFLIVVLLLSSLGLALTVQRVPRPYLAYAAPLVGALGWAQGAHRLWHPALVEYALALLPLVAAFYALAILRGRRADDLWPEPLQNVALIVSTLVLLPCLGEFLQSTSPGDGAMVTSEMLLYGILFTAIAWLRRSAVTLYAAATLLNGAYLFGLLHHAPALTRPLIALWLGLAGIAWLGAAMVWQRAALGIASLFPVAGGVALVSAGLALTDMHGDDALYALLIAGTTFTGIAWGLSRSEWVHLGICTYLLAYMAWMWERIGAPGLPNGDYFLIPVGLYTVALGLLARRGMLDASAPPFFLAGLLLILTPTYLAAREPSVGLPHALLLAVECLAAIFYGLTARVKVFLATGTAFLLLWIQLSLRSVTGQGSWAISALGLGLAIIGSALYLEKRRDRQTGWSEAAQHEWRRWE